jgi:hypothetical protein
MLNVLLWEKLANISGSQPGVGTHTLKALQSLEEGRGMRKKIKF